MSLWARISRWLRLRDLNGFDRWHFSGRPRQCIECGRQFRWRLHSTRRRIYCPMGHEKWEWEQHEEWGGGPWE